MRREGRIWEGRGVEWSGGDVRVVYVKGEDGREDEWRI